MGEESRVLDSDGFLKEGEHILVVWPIYDTILPLRVKSIANKHAKFFNYGPVPFTFSGYPKGVIPGKSVAGPFRFIDITGRLTGEYAGDMFYHNKAYKLIHAYVDIRPHLFRIYQEIPSGAKQYIYMEAVTHTTDVDVATSDFGYFTGVKEMLFFPDFHIDWYLYNGTNLPLRTYVSIKYAEYNVEIPRDPALVFDMMMRRYPAYWYTMPITTDRKEFRRMFTERYGFPEDRPGIPFYRAYEKPVALREIPEILKGVKI
jgi:hypothetical protein